ncbi:MAG: ABC transporter substrate-binding protein [Alkalibacterium sp.]|nr:ABC transporter substrate-binding protein [Alkalibacterium sp.]
MKSKGMFITIGAILIVLIGVFVTSLTNADSSESDNETEQAAGESSEQEILTVGILQTTSHPSLDEITAGSIEGLANHGYVDGENIEVVFQNAQGDQNLMNTMAQSLVDEGADLLIGIGTPASQAFANATSEIPIIMGAVSDPVGAGLVESEDVPGTNVTGVKNQAPVEAQLGLMQDILPDAQKVGLLYSSGEDNSRAEGERVTQVLEDMGLEAVTYTVSSTNEIQQMVATLSREVDVIYLPTDNTIASAFDTVVSEADRYDTPLIPTVDLMIAQGGLATVGINQTEMGEEAGRMAAEVLDGQDPSDFPVFVLSEGDILVNQEKADRLGIAFPQSVLDDATIIDNNE